MTQGRIWYRMKTITVTVRTNMVGSETTDSFEVEDNTSDKEIEDMAFTTAMEMVEWNYTTDEGI